MDCFTRGAALVKRSGSVNAIKIFLVWSFIHKCYIITGHLLVKCVADLHTIYWCVADLNLKKKEKFASTCVFNGVKTMTFCLLKKRFDCIWFVSHRNMNLNSNGTNYT